MVTRAAAVVIIALTVSSCSLWKNPQKGWAGATGGEQLERRFWKDIQEKNWVDLHRHLAPLFAATSSDATREREAALEYWKQLDLKSVSVAEVHARPAGADVVVTAVVTVTGTIAGRPIPPEPMHTMTVWQQVKNNWVAVAHSDALP